ncbi:Glu/Leu/Phe/Val dehydrogenase [Streptomyces malaysiensis]|uniref:hypothetical protein n=1 Tax=Streptomyces malaysiensis TaxID=92644 RepID=UPI002B31C3CA|nr:hypothetical protein R8789_16700 [Streptomyces malaysiensis]
MTITNLRVARAGSRGPLDDAHAQLRKAVDLLGYDESVFEMTQRSTARDVDVLVPAAVEGVIHERNASGIRARIVVEGANGPTTAAADEALAANGVLVVPDILANAGGVVVSYCEWRQANQAYWWSAGEVEIRLKHRMLAAWDRVREPDHEHDLTLRAAAATLAVKTVAEAHRARGLYPCDAADYAETRSYLLFSYDMRYRKASPGLQEGADAIADDPQPPRPPRRSGE